MCDPKEKPGMIKRGVIDPNILPVEDKKEVDNTDN